MIFHLYFNKQGLPEDQNAKQPHQSAIQARQWHTSNPSSHTSQSQRWCCKPFTSSTREEYKDGWDGNSLSFSLKISQRLRALQCLVVWLLCFADLQIEPQYLFLGFYYLCYNLDLYSEFQDSQGLKKREGGSFWGQQNGSTGKTACHANLTA